MRQLPRQQEWVSKELQIFSSKLEKDIVIEVTI
jgi:hypothetical protein